MLWTVAVFWACFGVILWETLLFPALLWVLSRRRAHPAAPVDLTPSVSLIIAAHNEERSLAAKLDNTLSLDYPTERLQIIVVSDASTDGTDAIAQSYAPRGVTFLRQAVRRGKTAAQNLAVSQARGEVVVFSDATALYQPAALRALVRWFADPSVGCATGKVGLGEQPGAAPVVVAGMQARWRYEEYVRSHQSRAVSMFGATGCIYAVRRCLYRPVPEDQVSDLVFPLLLLMEGYRTVFEPAAVATLERPVSAGRELQRRSRIVLQCVRAMWYVRRLLVPWRSGNLVAAISWYRLARWFLPVFLAALLLSNVALVLQTRWAPPYVWVFAAQVAFYALALLGGLLDVLRVRLPMVHLPFFFVWLNVAAGLALARLVLGEKAVTWKTVR